jgi:tetratricopeptide (TPR) repeat protein
MSFLSRLFGPKDEPANPAPKTAPGKQPAGKAPVGQLTQRLERLEEEAQNAAPGYVGTSYNRAGDLAMKEGDADRAMTFYGRAIDAFLADEQPEAARGVANKIIRIRPHAVRTLCTLTWLDLAAGHTATALLHLRDYVEAAKESKRQSHAAGQIFEMARVVADKEVLGAIADALDSLDFSPRAATVRAWEHDGGSPDAQQDKGSRAAACRDGAARSNERRDPTAKDDAKKA